MPDRGVEGAGCCDLAFAAPDAARRLKGAVVANQLARLGGYQWRDEADAVAEPVGVGATGGAPGCGWTPGPTAVRAFTAITAPS